MITITAKSSKNPRKCPESSLTTLWDSMLSFPRSSSLKIGLDSQWNLKELSHSWCSQKSLSSLILHFSNPTNTWSPKTRLQSVLRVMNQASKRLKSCKSQRSWLKTSFSSVKQIETATRWRRTNSTIRRRAAEREDASLLYQWRWKSQSTLIGPTPM